MVFGYNGLDRVLPDAVAGAVGSHATDGGILGALMLAAQGSAANGGSGGEAASVTKLSSRRS